MDIERLRHAAFLATGQALTTREAERLGRILWVPEEILPHLLLKRAGFEHSPQMRRALTAAIALAPDRPSTPRTLDHTDTMEVAAARGAVKAAVKALIDRDIANEDGHASLDHAMHDLASRHGPLESEAHLRIRR